jgi:sulfite reductase alpha subunit-like flavoprotein
LNGQQYLAGDHLVVMAENEPSIVEQLMDRLGCAIDCVICKPQHDGAAAGYPVLTGSNLDGHRPVLLRDLLTKAFDLSRPLSAQSFEYVQTKVTDPFEREQLQALSHAAMQRMQMPLVELLFKFKSIRLSVGEALALLPPLKPRLYSISSSPLHQASTLSITVGVVSGKTPTGRIHNGVCSTFLSRKPVGEKVWVMIRDTKSSFRPPAPELPMIMIGPGTGVAPMMGFLQERRSQRMAGQKVGEIVLFFGCRSENSFIYEEELNSYVADGTLAHLHVAFSRTGHKEYVQHLMAKHASRLWQMLQASTALRVNLLSPMHGTNALGI